MELNHYFSNSFDYLYVCKERYFLKYVLFYSRIGINWNYNSFIRKYELKSMSNFFFSFLRYEIIIFSRIFNSYNHKNKKIRKYYEYSRKVLIRIIFSFIIDLMVEN